MDSPKLCPSDRERGGTMRTSYSQISARLIVTGLFALALTAIPLRVALAQSPEPQKPTTEVQQLKDRVTQLEQTVDELKSLLKTTVAEQKKTEAATGEKVAAATDKVVPTTPVASTPGTAAKTPADEPKGESTFSVYGFAMLDM